MASKGFSLRFGAWIPDGKGWLQGWCNFLERDCHLSICAKGPEFHEVLIFLIFLFSFVFLEGFGHASKGSEEGERVKTSSTRELIRLTS